MQAGIVGMGVMGRVLARALHNAGWQVTLFDETSGDDNCSFAAAGLLTPFSELDKAELLIFHLGQESLQRCWPNIINQLNEAIYFQQTGSIILHHPQDEAEWHHFNRRIKSQLQDNQRYFQLLSGKNLVQLEPELSKFEHAYYFPKEAQIDCQSFMPSLKQYLQAQGVNFVPNTKVLGLKPKLIVTQSKSYHFDWVFDCRGLGAKAVFNDLRPLRGELIWLYAPEVHLTRPIRLLHPRYSLYIVPRSDNIYLIGASEIEAHDHSAISVRSTLELLTAAYFVHSGFIEARIIKTVTQCRPTLTNHLPRIRFAQGLIAINGLYRHGFLIAPALVEEVLRSLSSNHQDLYYPSIWEHL